MMNCPVITAVHGDYGPETELWPDGRRVSWHEQEDLLFLQQRFPGFCPYHILHNLLGLHYSRHEFCTAAPFSDVLCRHGSHQRPSPSREETISTAPAEGAVVFLPFGLSRRAGDGLLATGCVDCEHLQETDACGACRRLWTGGRPVPASGYTDHGRCARLADWRAAVGLTGRAVGEEPVPDDGGEGSEEEWSEEEGEEDAEEEWEEEESDEWGGDAEGGDASWNATEAGGWDDADAVTGRASLLGTMLLRRCKTLVIGALGVGSRIARGVGGGSWTSPPRPPLLCPMPRLLRRRSPLRRPPIWCLLLCRQYSPPGLRRLRRLLPLRLASPSVCASWSCSSSSSSSSGSAWPKRGCGVLGQSRPRAGAHEGPAC